MGDILQYKTGTIDAAASATIVLDNPTEAGNTIIVIGGSGLNVNTGAVGFAAPTGGAGTFAEQPFTGSGSNTSRVRIEAWAQKNVAAGETTYTFAKNGAISTVTGIWLAMEVTGLWDGNFSGLGYGSSLEPPFYASISQDASDGLHSDTGNTGKEPARTTFYVPSDTDVLQSTRFYKALGISVFLANEDSSTQPVISGYSADQNELVQLAATFAAGHSLTMAVTYRKHYDLGRFNATASVSPNAYLTCNEMVWADADSRFAPTFDAITGFEMGTTSGLTAVSIAAAGTGPFDASAGSPTIQSAITRTGNYALKLTATAGICWVAWTDPGVLGYWQPNVATGVDHPITRISCFYFDASLPSGDVELLSIEAGSASNSVKVWYRSASQKIGVKIGTGTEQLSDSTVSANKWIQIPWRYVSFLTTHTLDWSIRYDSLDPASLPVAQTQATKAGMTAAQPTAVVWGWKSNTTATVYYDDDAVCKQFAPHPLSDVHVSPLLVDPTGTPTITGTTTNFQTYTANGTGTAWNAVTARNNISDMPPTIGASSDGIMQVTAAANDYVTIPMDTLNLGQTMSPRAVRWYVPIWAASGTAATLRVRSVDGATTLFDSTLADHGQDAAAALWICGMQRLTNTGNTARLWQLTKTRLDALTLDFGFSTDASPDVGIHAVLAEVAWVPPSEFVIGEVTDDIDGLHRVIQRQDPDSGALLGYFVTTPNNGRGATLTWTANGTPASQYVPTNSTASIDLNLDGVSQLTEQGLTPDGA